MAQTIEILIISPTLTYLYSSHLEQLNFAYNMYGKLEHKIQAFQLIKRSDVSTSILDIICNANDNCDKTLPQPGLKKKK